MGVEVTVDIDGVGGDTNFVAIFSVSRLNDFFGIGVEILPLSGNEADGILFGASVGGADEDAEGLCIGRIAVERPIFIVSTDIIVLMIFNFFDARGSEDSAGGDAGEEQAGTHEIEFFHI